MSGVNTPEETINKKDIVTDVEDTVEHLTALGNIVEDFTLDNLTEYCETEEDNINRVLYRASEILINRHSYEFNLIITQLINSLSGKDQTEEDELNTIKEFNEIWISKGLGFD